MSATNWKNVNNWHWTEKNCIHWAKDYFTRSLCQTKISDAASGVSVWVTSVGRVEGDVDLNQRKGKLITLFDIALTMSWQGENAKGDTFSGDIKVPEVAHDTDVDDYQFEISVNESGSAAEAVRQIVRLELTRELRKKFAQFGEDLIAAHAKDVYIAPENVPTNDASVAGAKANGQALAGKQASGGADQTSSSSSVKTVTIQESIEFMCSAEDLWQALTDTGRVCAWTRAPAKMSSVVGDSFSLLDGNIVGTVTESSMPKRLTMQWRVKSWPKDHYSTVEMRLTERSDSCHLEMTQTHVPAAEEAITRSNWRNYYWNGIKQAFGYVELAPRSPPPSSSSLFQHAGRTGKRKKKRASRHAWTPATLGVTAAVAVALTAVLWITVSPMVSWNSMGGGGGGGGGRRL